MKFQSYLLFILSITHLSAAEKPVALSPAGFLVKGLLQDVVSKEADATSSERLADALQAAQLSESDRKDPEFQKLSTQVTQLLVSKGRNLETLSKMAEAKLPVDYVDASRESLAMSLVRKKEYALLSQLLQKKVIDIHNTNEKGEDAYSLAIEAGEAQLAHQIYSNFKQVDVKSFVAEAKKRGITDKEGLVKLMGEISGDSYVLMMDSESVQGASSEKPRAMMAQQNGFLIATFTDLPGDAKGSALEMRDFDLKTKRLAYQEIDASKLSQTRDINLALSQRNPAICISCHRAGSEGGRDLWNQWPFWEGAAGSVDDLTAQPTAHTSWGNYLAQNGRSQKISQDAEALRKFISSNLEGTGYAHLKDLQQRFDPAKRDNRVPEFSNQPDVRKADAPRPNMRYTRQLTVRNFDRVAGSIIDNPQYPKLRFSVLAALRGCVSSKVVPEESRFENLRVLASTAETGIPEQDLKRLTSSKMSQSSAEVKRDTVTSIDSIRQLYALDMITGSNFTNNMENANFWTTVTPKGIAPAGPFAVGPGEVWELSRLADYLRVHDETLRKLSAEELKCEALVERSNVEVTAKLSGEEVKVASLERDPAQEKAAADAQKAHAQKLPVVEDVIPEEPTDDELLERNTD
jgi:hypothetical protein